MDPSLGRLGCVLAGLAAGCLLQEGLTPPRATALLAAAAPLLVSRRALPSLGALLGVALALGALGMGWRLQRAVALEEMASDVAHCAVTGRVIEEAGGLGTLVAAEVARCDGFEAVHGAGVMVLDPGTGDPGATLVATGWLIPLSDDDFDSARRRAGAQAAFDALDVRVIAKPSGPWALAAGLRNGLERAAAGLEPDRAALLRGLSIGDTTGMAAGVTESLRRSGLTHLVAVSGTNVALVVGAVALLSARASMRMRVILCGLALSLYVLVVGPEPSVLRAAVMGAIGLWALCRGRRVDPLKALALALIVVLAARPGLLWSVGLQLSAAATAGLVLFSGRLSRLFGFLPRPVAFGLGATLAAQMAVAPLLVGVFGRLSLVAPLSNLAAMPAVAPATVLGLLSGAVGTLDANLGGFVARLAEPFVAWILFVGERAGGVSWAALDLPHAAAWLLALPLLICTVAVLHE